MQKRPKGMSAREMAAKKAGKPMPYSQKKFDKVKQTVYKSGMAGNKPINFSSPKTKRGVISSID